MTKYTIKKGNHHVFNPRIFRIILSPQKKEFIWRFKFDENCRYIIPHSFTEPNKYHEDQKDWNKICGIDFESIFSTMKYTIMGGWRYNPNTKRIELNAYFHDGKGVSNRTMSKTLMTCLPDEEVELKIVPTLGEWKVIYTLIKDQTTATFTLYPVNAKKNFKFATEINWYFGGNQPAPQDITIYKETVQ